MGYVYEAVTILLALFNIGYITLLLKERIKNKLRQRSLLKNYLKQAGAREKLRELLKKKKEEKKNRKQQSDSSSSSHLSTISEINDTENDNFEEAKEAEDDKIVMEESGLVEIENDKMIAEEMRKYEQELLVAKLVGKTTK